MIIFQIQRDLSLTMLSQRGIARGIYAPLLFRLLWKIGVNVPPPHLIGFTKLAVIWGAWFGLVWGAIMWVFVWSHQDTKILLSAGSAIAAATFFGLSLAAVYARDRKKYDLPTWASFGASINRSPA